MSKTIGFLVKISIVGLVLLSCNSSDNEGKVASVGDAVLYNKTLQNLTKGMSSKDSLYFARRYVKSWIRNELLLEKAKMNLTDEEQDVEDLVKNYRSSLLINQYKQKYIKQHLDTLVRKREVDRYIKDYASNFKLTEPIYQFYYARVSSRKRSDIRRLKRLFSQSRLKLTEDLGLSTGTLLESYDENWHTEAEILNLLPAKKGFGIRDLKRGAYYTTKENDIVYFVKIKKTIKVGSTTPSVYIFNKVKEIVIHKRKINIAKGLEYDIYEDAKKNGLFEMY